MDLHGGPGDRPRTPPLLPSPTRSAPTPTSASPQARAASTLPVLQRVVSKPRPWGSLKAVGPLAASRGPLLPLTGGLSVRQQWGEAVAALETARLPPWADLSTQSRCPAILFTAPRATRPVRGQQVPGLRVGPHPFRSPTASRRRAEVVVDLTVVLPSAASQGSRRCRPGPPAPQRGIDAEAARRSVCPPPRTSAESHVDACALPVASLLGEARPGLPVPQLRVRLIQLGEPPAPCLMVQPETARRPRAPLHGPRPLPPSPCSWSALPRLVETAVAAIPVSSSAADPHGGPRSALDPVHRAPARRSPPEAHRCVAREPGDACFEVCRRLV